MANPRLHRMSPPFTGHSRAPRPTSLKPPGIDFASLSSQIRSDILRFCSNDLRVCSNGSVETVGSCDSFCSPRLDPRRKLREEPRRQLQSPPFGCAWLGTVILKHPQRNCRVFGDLCRTGSVLSSERASDAVLELHSRNYHQPDEVCHWTKVHLSLLGCQRE